MKQGYQVIFKQKKYMLNIYANLINRFGDAVDAIAFSWLVYALTGSASWSAIILGVNLIPNILIQPIAGAIVERLNKKRTMIVCDISRGVITGVILIFYLNDMLNPWILLVITFILNSFESFRNPASTCFVPMLLTAEHYEYGLAFNQSSSRVCELIGTGLAGVVIAVFGLQGAIIIDMLSFFLSALIITFISVKEKLEKQKSSIFVKIKDCIQLMKEGFLYMIKSKIMILICFIAFIINMVLTPFNSFVVPYINGVLHGSANTLSMISMALTIGIAIGSFIYPYIHKHITNRLILISGGAATGIFYISLSLLPLLENGLLQNIVLALSGFLYGIMVGQMISLSGIAFMQNVQQEYLARASAMFSAMVVMGMPIISFIMSALSSFVGIVEIFIFFGVFTIIIFIAMMSIKTMKEL